MNVRHHSFSFKPHFGTTWRHNGSRFLMYAVVGVIAGLGAITFQYLSQLVALFALVSIAGYAPLQPLGEENIFHVVPSDFSPLLLIASITLGGLVSGFLVFTFAPEAEGHGTDAAIEAYHQKKGIIRARIPLVKLVASAITIGTGGSGGREGPIAQIGAGFGSLLAVWLGLPARDRRILLAAGLAGGIGAIFRAPLAGAIFAAEILYRDADIESDVIVPSVITSTIAYSVYTRSISIEKRYDPLFGNSINYTLQSPMELIPLALLAVVLVMVGIFYIRFFYGTHHVFNRIPIPKPLKPALGACLAGLAALGLYHWYGNDMRALAVLTTGYGLLQSTFTDCASVGIPLLLSVGLIKIMTTSLTISSGGSAGVFGPSLVIGGCISGAVGLFLNQYWPGITPKPEVFAIVGMAGFFSGCAHAPLSTIVMVSELTGDYRLLLPTMWVSTLCFVFCRRWTLYSKQVPSRVDSPAHFGDRQIDILEGLLVESIPLEPQITVSPRASFREIAQILSDHRQNYFPVVNEKGELEGIFTANDVWPFLSGGLLLDLAIATDALSGPPVTISQKDDLNVALERFTQFNHDELPVVDPANPKRLIGMLRRKDLLAIYLDRVHAIREQAK